MGGLKVLTAQRPADDGNALRQMGTSSGTREPNVVAVLASTNEDKITFLAVCGKQAVAQGIKAGDLVKSVCAICGGKGGRQARQRHGRRQGPGHLGASGSRGLPLLSQGGEPQSGQRQRRGADIFAVVPEQ